MTYLTNDHFLESPAFPFNMIAYQVNDVIFEHAHEFVELVYVSTGRGWHIYRGEKFAISEGDVFVIEPEVVHAYDIDPASPFEVYNVLFHPSFLSRELKALSEVDSYVDFFYMEPFIRNSVMFQTRLTLSIQQQSEMEYLFRKLLGEFTGKEAGYRFLVKTKLIEILVTLSRYYAKKETSMAEQPNIHILLNRVCDFIDAHCEKSITLEQVSRMCGLGSTTFTMKFKNHTGCTFLEYRNEMRIRRAKRLLADTDDKIIAIAHQTGFEDVSHFNRTFKQHTQLTPREFREHVKFS